MKESTAARPPQILLVDDDPTDALFLTESFKALPKSIDVRTVATVDAAIEVVSDPRTCPAIVLLDDCLAGEDGFAFLEYTRSQPPPLCCLPVIMLSGLASPEVVRKAYCLHVNAFLEKPVRGYSALARTVAEFWLKNVKFARQG